MLNPEVTLVEGCAPVVTSPDYGLGSKRTPTWFEWAISTIFKMGEARDYVFMGRKSIWALGSKRTPENG